jgi:FAD:protein FMN transferase
MKLRIIILLFVVLGLSGCHKPAKYFYNEGNIYGTIYHFIYESPEGKDLHEEIKLKLKGYNKTFSTFDSTSIISKVNRNLPVELNEIFLKCFKRAMEISEITDGAFDITAGPMVNAWGFGPEARQKMTENKIDSLKQITGYHKVKLRDGVIVKDNPNMKLDMSAIAKGYTSDLIAEFLSSKGCENYLVEIGGEVVAKGKNERGRTWTIGISKPDESVFFAANEIQAKVKMAHHALATSGNYRNFYVEEGKKYAHTINPKTGYPVQHSLLSTTVLTDNCMDADAFATAFMVLGLEESIRIAAHFSGLKVYFIYADEGGMNQVYMSDNFREHLTD